MLAAVKDCHEGREEREVDTSQYNPSEPVLQVVRVEVHQEASADTGGLQVRQHLCAVDRPQPFNCLQLYHDRALDNQIDVVRPQPMTRSITTSVSFDSGDGIRSGIPKPFFASFVPSWRRHLPTPTCERLDLDAVPVRDEINLPI